MFLILKKIQTYDFRICVGEVTSVKKESTCIFFVNKFYDSRMPILKNPAAIL